MSDEKSRPEPVKEYEIICKTIAGDISMIEFIYKVFRRRSFKMEMKCGRRILQRAKE